MAQPNTQAPFGVPYLLEGHVMNEIYECFRNRREVPPQEPSAEHQLLEELTTAAKKVGTEWAHSMARE